jgi:hypothetical protein
MKNQEVNSIFYHSQFIFELLSNNTNEKYLFEALNVDNKESESEYIRICIEESQKNKFDYLLYSDVYTIHNIIYFKVVLKNPYNDEIVIDLLYSEKNDFYVNEYLTENAKEIIQKINDLNLQKVKNKKVKFKEDQVTQEIEVKEPSKHEVFIMNGFFKNNPTIMSLFSWYLGYDYSPIRNFNIESAFFWGSGYTENSMEFKSEFFSEFFFGTYASIHLFLPGIIEPSLGIRIETGYLINENAYLSLPIDMGIKIYMTKKNVLKINSSFQYTYFNINNRVWENNFIIGIIIGYAWKI